jgi:hypothetical protein
MQKKSSVVININHPLCVTDAIPSLLTVMGHVKVSNFVVLYYVYDAISHLADHSWSILLVSIETSGQIFDAFTSVLDVSNAVFNKQILII